MRCLPIQIVVVETKKKTTLSSVFDSLQDGGISEVISDVADLVLQTPVSSRCIISRDCLVKGCAIISISFENDLSASEVLCEGDVHGA